jgi:hypothetical protein
LNAFQLLSDFVQKIERIEHLKIALRPGQQILAGKKAAAWLPPVK